MTTKSTNKAVGISPDIHQAAKIEAAKRGIKLSELTERALVREIKTPETKKKP